MEKDYPLFIPEGLKNYHFRYYDPEKKYTRTLSTRTPVYSEAVKEYKKHNARRILKIKNDNFIQPGDKRYKLSEALELANSSKIIKPKTETGYKTAVTQFIKVCNDKQLYLYTKEDFRKFTAALKKAGRARNTIANYTTHLRSLFNWFQTNKLITENIIEVVTFQFDEPVPIPPADMNSIFNNILDYDIHERSYVLEQRINYHKFFRMKYLAAMRLNEAVMAEVDDFDYDQEVLYIRNNKGSRVDMIPMPRDLKEFMQSLDLPAAGKVFPSISYDSAKCFWQRLKRKHHIKYHIHQFRGTRGTDLANQGVKPLFLQKFMRHRDFATTQRHYLWIETKKAREDINNAIGSKISLEISLENSHIQTRLAELKEKQKIKKASNL